MSDERLRPERPVWRPDVQQDVDDELAFHLEMRAREYAGRGVSEADARAAAARRFGDLGAVAASCAQIDRQFYQEQRRARMLTDARQDVVHAARSLRNHPGFTLVTVLTLALGIGATTAIFSVINAVLLRPLPFPDTDRLVFLWSLNGDRREPLTPGRLVDFREQMTSAAAIAGISQIPLNLTGSGDPERLAGSSVSSAFFDVLGVPPLLGKTFQSGDASERAVVLSHALWVRRFGSDPAIVGRTITINGRTRDVVAVMPPSFEWPTVTATGSPSGGPELWIPGTSRDIPRTPTDREDLDLSLDRGAGYLRAVARLKPGVTVEQARQEAAAISGRLAQQYPASDGGRSATVRPLREQFFGMVRTPLLILLGAVAFVLAIVCANVASLLLGRATGRRKEIALRMALGASRGRVVRQLLTEALVLAMAGGGCGLLLAWWGRAWLGASVPPDIMKMGAPGLDGVTLVFAAGIAVLTGVIFGIVPAWQISRTAVNADLAEGTTRASSGPRGGRTRDLLVAVQICVALVLLVGAALLLQSFVTLTRVDTGIDTRNLLTFDVFLSGDRAGYQAKQIAFYDEMLARIRGLPGVTAAGAAVTLPIGGDDFGAPITIEGQPLPPEGHEPQVGFQVVTPGYFATMGIPVLAGRDFHQSDRRGSQPVVMVNETLARQQWPGVDPLGRRMRIGRSGDWMTVVGLVGDIRHFGPAAPPRPEFYQPNAQQSFSFMAFVVRTAADPSGSVQAIRAAVASLDPSLPISGVAEMDEHLANALARPRFMATLTAAFGALALALAVVGVYGVMAYSVSQRTQEIAIRMALGARRGDVVQMVLAKAARLASFGVVAGLVAAAAMSRVLGGLLFGVTATDAATFAAAALVLLAVALLAAALPAFRASRISGAAILRS
jgi:predicted permease